MDKIWYIILDGATLGPYSFLELRSKPITPDTLCWKEGMEGWTPIRDVPDLKDLFKDPVPLNEEEDEDEENLRGEGEVASLAVKEPNFIFWWLIIAALILSYLLSQLF
jgi:hypothetical protein